jgi:hypothetical protein
VGDTCLISKRKLQIADTLRPSTSSLTAGLEPTWRRMMLLHTTISSTYFGVSTRHPRQTLSLWPVLEGCGWERVLQAASELNAVREAVSAIRRLLSPLACVEMVRVEVERVGLKWVGLSWVGIIRIELLWIELMLMELVRIEMSRVELIRVGSRRASVRVRRQLMICRRAVRVAQVVWEGRRIILRVQRGACIDSWSRHEIVPLMIGIVCVPGGKAVGRLQADVSRWLVLSYRPGIFRG